MSYSLKTEKELLPPISILGGFWDGFKIGFLVGAAIFGVWFFHALTGGWP